MSDLPNGAASPAPATPAAPAPPPVTEREVANVLVGLLDKPDSDDTPPREPREDTESPDTGDAGIEDDVGADESPPTDDGPVERDDTPIERASIEPPAGWNAKEREVWSKLPQPAQEAIRRRESELTAGYTRATQERAEIERMATARLDQANQDRSQYIQNLEVFRKVMVPAAEQLAQVDWPRLAAENPAEYVRLSAERDAMQQRFALVEGEVQRIQQEYQQQAAQQREQAKRVGYERLVEAMPEFRDPTQARQLGSELGQFLRTCGFSDQEITDCTDDRAIRLAMRAMRAEKSTAAVNSANTKRTPPPAPQVQRPGSSQNGADSGSRRMTQLATRFSETRSVQDAARIVAEWMK